MGYISLLIRGMVGVQGLEGFGDFLKRKSVFSDEVPVNAGDICTAVNEGTGVDDFESMRGHDQLNGDLHCLGYRRYKYR